MAKTTNVDTQATVKLVINGQTAKTTLKELTDAQRSLNTELRNMKPSDPGYKERLKEVQLVNRAVVEQRREMAGVTTESKKLASGWKDIAKGVLAGGAIAAGVAILRDLGRQIIQNYTQFEKYRAILDNSLGSLGAANRAMAQLQDFAKNTPFALSELTDSYVKFVNRGIQPSMAEMTKMGDLAASQGKDFSQLTEAILDAGTGEFERLKEFGIRARKNGDVVSLSFKGITKEVKNTEKAISQAIMSFAEMEGVSGTMAKTSATLGGQISNMSDNWGQLLTTLGSSTGTWLSTSVGVINEYLSFLTDAIKSTEQRINEGIDTRVGRNIDSFKNRTQKEQFEIIEGTKLLIKDYETEVQRLYTIGDAERAEKQQQLLDTEKRTLEAYQEYQKQQIKIKENAEAEKKRLAQVAADAEQKREKKDAEEKAKRLAQQMKKEHDSLKDLAKSMQQDFDIEHKSGLEKKLAEISKTYDPLIEKARKFKDEALAGIFQGMKTAEGDEAKAGAKKLMDANSVSEFNKQFNQTEGLIEKASEENILDNKNRFANGEISEEEYTANEFDLENQRLLALKLLYESYGKDSIKFEKELTDKKLEEKRRLAEGHMELAQSEMATEQAVWEAMATGVSMLKGIVDQSSAAFKALLVAEKAVAIAKVIMNTQVEIAGYFAKYSGIPGGAVIAAGLAAQAKVRSGISIGIIAAQGIAEAITSNKTTKSAKYATGGILPEGPTHADGGLKLVDDYGNIHGEIEGGEPILSRETYRNNRQTIDALLYSSQRQSGANISLSTSGIASAERVYRNGGILPGSSGSSSTASQSVINNNYPIKTDNRDVVEKLDTLISVAGNAWNYRVFEERKTRIESARNSQSS